MLTMDYRSLTWILLATLVSVHVDETVGAEKLKLCVVETARSEKRIGKVCSKFHSQWSPVDCVIGNDRFNCLRQLTIGDADMAILEPEDLVAASAYSEYNILVTNELRLFPDEKQEFEMVALAHRDVESYWNMRGKRFCHPGFETTNDWTKAFQYYFQDWIIPKKCDHEKTLLENRISDLSNYFEAACIAGPWSPDVKFDAELKIKYKNLCALCDNPAGCYTSDKYYGREGVLLCLTDNAGDIAWARLDDTLEHFKDERINKQDYSYICPDDTTRPMGFGKPCVWMTKPWPVITARSEVAERVSKFMSSLKESNAWWATDLMELMEAYHPTPVSTDTLETPEDYLRRFPNFMSAYRRSSCRPSRRVQWCVSSNLEERKCRHLREASFNYGIEPAIACIQEPNRTACVEAVRSERADIFVARTDELLETKKKGLKPIVRVVSNKRQDLDRIAVVTKKTSKYKVLRDVKGAKACFSGYRNMGWNAFDATMRRLLPEKWACSDAQAISDYFNDSCVLGLANNHSEVPSNLYSLCKQGGKYGDEVSTFDCLSSGLGDVAIVNLKHIEKKIGTIDQGRGSLNPINMDYVLLCEEEFDNEELMYKYNEDSTCLLAWSTLGSVIAHENITKMRHEEIYSMLLEIDNLFGSTFKGTTPAFLLYGSFDSGHNVIFPEETQHLHLEGNQIQRVRSYEEIVDDMVKRPPCSTAVEWRPSYVVIILQTALVATLSQL